MNVFNYDCYKTFVNEWVQEQPKGQFQKISTAVNIHSSHISKVFRGDKHLTVEQAYDLCSYIGFDRFETEYFMTLVHKERAGTPQLKNYLETYLGDLRNRAFKVAHKFERKKELTSRDKERFYSHWYYSAIWLLTSIPQVTRVEQIADLLHLQIPLVKEVMQFLIQIGMCIGENGTLDMGSQQIHVGPDSPWMSRHHINWRLRAHAHMDQISSSETFFTAPLSISVEDSFKIKKMILEMIEGCVKIVEDSPAEKVSCLNIDWVDIVTPPK